MPTNPTKPGKIMTANRGEIAKSKGVTMIHPGYGFLSENPAFARACAREGIIFIGPSPELLENMGDKTAARALAHKFNVPVLPGTEEH